MTIPKPNINKLFREPVYDDHDRANASVAARLTTEAMLQELTEYVTEYADSSNKYLREDTIKHMRSWAAGFAPPRKKICIIAGTYAQAKRYIQANDLDTDHYTFIHTVDYLRHFMDISYVLVGTYYELSEWKEIEQELKIRGKGGRIR